MGRAKTSKPEHKRRKSLPNMDDWSDERIAEFWETHNSTEFVDQMEQVDVHVDAPADYRVISMRLESEDVDRAKRVARSKGMPYTVLLRMWIKEKLEEAGRT